MGELTRFSAFDTLIPATPRRVRDWIPYLGALTQDPRFLKMQPQLLQKKRKSLLRELEQHVSVSLRGNLKCVLSQEAEPMVVA